jgi:hypothetical protein
MVELSAGMKISRILASTRQRRRDEDEEPSTGAPERRRSADTEGSSVEWRWRRPTIAGEGDEAGG